MIPDKEPENSRAPSVEVHSDRFRQLLNDVRAGSSQAAWELVEIYGSHIRAVVRRRMHPRMRPFVDSEDFTQSVWKSFFGDSSLLDDINDPEHLVALLVRMSGNKVVDEYRRRMLAVKSALPSHGVDEESESIRPLPQHSLGDTPSQVAIARERWDRLMVNNSTQVCRIVELRMAGHTYVEIASILEISERTVRRVIDRLEAEARSP